MKPNRPSEPSETKAVTFRLPKSLVEQLASVADSQNCTQTHLVQKALAMYFEYLATDGASFLGVEVQKQIEASNTLFESRVLNRLAPLLSELAIQNGVLAAVIAQELEVNPANLSDIRREVYQTMASGNTLLNLKALLDNYK